MKGSAFEDAANRAKDGADDDDAEAAEAVGKVAGDCCWNGAAEHDQRDGEAAHGGREVAECLGEGRHFGDGTDGACVESGGILVSWFASMLNKTRDVWKERLSTYTTYPFSMPPSATKVDASA